MVHVHVIYDFGAKNNACVLAFGLVIWLRDELSNGNEIMLYQQNEYIARRDFSALP